MKYIYTIDNGIWNVEAFEAFKTNDKYTWVIGILKEGTLKYYDIDEEFKDYPHYEEYTCVDLFSIEGTVYEDGEIIKDSLDEFEDFLKSNAIIFEGINPRSWREDIEPQKRG